ncbi:MAG: choice-of-anchor I family protein [Burkholderiales bacterium]|nr:choice-of-anchor I family protein [Burkholderiales bacterium]
MNKNLLAVALAVALSPLAVSAQTFSGMSKAWTYNHTASGFAGQTAEIVAFDNTTNALWVAGVAGVDILNATNGSFIGHINTTSYGYINSVAIHNGVAAFAIEAPTRTNAGMVQFYDTATRTLSAGNNNVAVGALPDMLTFTPNGSKLLVANEGTPSTYGTPALDPVGSVSIIDMASRTVVASPTFQSAPQTGSAIRTNTGMDFEPEYIAVSKDGSKAFVSLQEANAMGVVNLATNTTEKVVGLGLKDFSVAGNEMDPKKGGGISFSTYAAKGLYMPDGMASYDAGGRTLVVMANEGDFREDDVDRSKASDIGASGDLAGLRVSNTDSSTGNLITAGARSFSIRDADGNMVYDSGSILDREAALRGIYDDGRSRDKGVEPEGVELMVIGGKTFAFIGLERTTKGAVAIFDITTPENASFIDMIVTNGDLAPEGLKGYQMGGKHYLAIANETSNTTTVYALAPVPEPETYAMLLAGLGLLGVATRRKSKFQSSF